MFEELDDLKQKVMIDGGNWIGIEEDLFQWKSDLVSLVRVSKTVTDITVDTMCLPLKDVNWTNYATLLYSMASGNFTSVFKKAPFNADNFAILTGPCCIEISSTNPQMTQSQGQSLLLNTLGDYSASSMDELATAETQKKRSTLRRKETTRTVSSQLKSEIVLPDFVKHFKNLLKCDEQELIALLLKYERPCCELLDKNSDAVVSTDSSSSTSLFDRIKSDNETNKPVAHRVFDLIQHFFISSLQHSFPANLSGPMINIIGLFRSSVFSLKNLMEFLGFDSFLIFLLGANEILVDAELPSFNLNYLEFHKDKIENHPESSKRFELLKIFSKGKGTARIEESLSSISDSLSSVVVLYTRYHKILPSNVTKDSIKSRITSLEREHLIAAAETNENENYLTTVNCFGENKDEIFRSIGGCDMELKVRLCKILLSSNESDFKTEIVEIALKELLNFFSSLSLSKFIEYLQFFLSKSDTLTTLNTTTIISNYLCIFWHIYSKRQLIPNSLTQPLNSLFIQMLCEVIDKSTTIKGGPSSIDSMRFLLLWAVQERALGSLDGQLPLKIFRFFSGSGAEAADGNDDSSLKFAYSNIASLYKFPNIFTLNEGGIEEWDRSPIGIGSRDAPCPNLKFDDFIALTSLIDKLTKYSSSSPASNTATTTTTSISDPGLVNFIDWIKKQFIDLMTKKQVQSQQQHPNVPSIFKQFYSLNRQLISEYLNTSLLFLKGTTRSHINNYDVSSLNQFRSLLNIRSDLVYSELQGRKKSFDILKIIRSDLKISLAINHTDPEVWKLLGVCYYDSAVHYLSSEAEVITSESAKLKRMIKKAIFAFKFGLTLDNAATSESEIDLVNWTKLSDLIDWSLHEPSKLSQSASEISFLASIGCSCVQMLLSKVLPRDRWIHLLRLDIFLRHFSHLQDHVKQLNLLLEASKAAAASYSENVYESTALYMSLVKVYSRLSKLKMKNLISDQVLLENLTDIQSYLPTCLKSCITEETEPPRTADEILLNHLEALNVLDRKKIFHSHIMTLSLHSFHVQVQKNNAPSNSFPDPFTSYLPQLFPFLKQRQQQQQQQLQQKKTTSFNGSLLQIYQSDHERPARFLMAGRRYLLQLLDFFNFIEDVQERVDLLTQFLKKLHYIRKTIIGFPEILSKATLLYFDIASAQPDALSVADELIESVKSAYDGWVPQEITEKYADFIQNQNQNQNQDSNITQP